MILWFVCCSIFITILHMIPKLYNLNCDLSVLFRIYSFGFSDLAVHFWGSLLFPYPCARFGPLLLSLWNQDWYWWLKLPIFGCIVTIWFGAARSQSLMIFPYSQNMLPFLEQCTMRSIPVTCDCYMLEKEFRNHPLQSVTCNKTKSTKFPLGYRMKSTKSPLYAKPRFNLGLIRSQMGVHGRTFPYMCAYAFWCDLCKICISVEIGFSASASFQSFQQLVLVFR